MGKEKEMKKAKIGLTMLFLVCLLVLPSAGMSDDTQLTTPATLTWVAGGVGGGWYVQAGGIARMITEAEPKLILKVVPGGGVVNPVRVSRGKDDLGWGITFVDKMAFKGMAPLFKTANPNVRSLGAYSAPIISILCPAKTRASRPCPKWRTWSRPASPSRWPCP